MTNVYIDEFELWPVWGYRLSEDSNKWIIDVPDEVLQATDEFFKKYEELERKWKPYIKQWQKIIDNNRKKHQFLNNI